MRPHRLTMKAFGPFAEETSIDFDAMGSSIYLICGDTGAGKTTIFDAIMYALYGTASGGGRSRLGTEAFHSDFAKNDKGRGEMSVELVFSNAGRTYTVLRRMYWGKNGTAAKPVKEAVLSENGSAVVFAKGREDRDDVTAKVTEILGLDADQFRRIIMLAQGEFQKFLESDSATRGEILGKLYDNRRHRDLEARLKAAGNLLENTDRDLARDVRAQLEIFRAPEDVTPEEAGALAPEHPALCDTIDALVLRMEERAKALRDRRADLEKKRDALAEEKTKGEAQNALFDELETKQKQLDVLLSRGEDMKARGERLERMQAAAKVLPDEERVRETAKALAGTLARITLLEKQTGELSERQEALAGAADALKKKNLPLIGELAAGSAAIREILHFYKDLQESLEALRSEEKREKTLEEQREAAAKTLAEKEERCRQLDEQIGALADAGDAAVTAAAQREELAEKRLGDLERLQTSVQELKEIITAKERLGQEARAAEQAALAAEKEHARLHEALLEGQAGLLADELRTALESAGSAKCPVCGAVHTKEEIGDFAVCTADVPSREAVDAAREARDRAEETAASARSSLREKETEHRLREESVLNSAASLTGEGDWEALAEGSALRAETEKARGEKRRAAEAVLAAKNDRDLKARTLLDREEAGREAAGAREELEAAGRAAQEAAGRVQTAKTSAGNWKKQLEGYPETEEQAAEKIRELEEQAASLQAGIDGAAAKLEECRRELSRAEGSRSAALEEKKQREEALAGAQAAFEESLARQSFAGAEAFREALGGADTRDALNQRIRSEQEVLEEYSSSLTGLRAATKQLAEMTEGKSRTDLAETEAAAAQNAAALEQLRGQERRLDLTIETDRGVQTQIRKIRKERAQYRRAMDELMPIADAANGSLAFSRYVLGDFFGRIVDRANVHLETITDGRFRLIAQDTGDLRRSRGLGLKILDMFTGLERDTASLSGGQSFEASLSLALGLSDIVQMDAASAIRIDSMFIDEGFGSLDGLRLDRAVEVLSRLSGGRRQIGIISHVARLDEVLPKKIHVIAGPDGSRVKIETDV